MTPRELECLHFIFDYWVAYEQGPVAREIREHLGVGPQWIVDTLLARGLLARIPGRHRTLVVTEAGVDALDRAALSEAVRKPG